MPYYTLNEVLTLSSPTVKNILSLGHVATVTASQNVGVHLKLALFADGARGASPPLLDMGSTPLCLRKVAPHCHVHYGGGWRPVSLRDSPLQNENKRNKTRSPF